MLLLRRQFYAFPALVISPRSSFLLLSAFTFLHPCCSSMEEGRALIWGQVKCLVLLLPTRLSFHVVPCPHNWDQGVLFLLLFPHILIKDWLPCPKSCFCMGSILPRSRNRVNSQLLEMTKLICFKDGFPSFLSLPGYTYGHSEDC